jgi:hypothetical protein
MITDREQWNLDRAAEQRYALAEFKRHHPEIAETATRWWINEKPVEEPMIEASAATAATEQQQMIADCSARTARLTLFDLELLVSLKTELDRGTELSPKLAEALEDIWQRATARG